MATTHIPPNAGAKSFHCPYCSVLAHQLWRPLREHVGGGYSDTEFKTSVCMHCSAKAYWYKNQMIVPATATAPPPHPDLPQECVGDYLEARDIADRSPRAAAALLRLVVQKLMPSLGERGRNINDDIGSLVQKGLPTLVQQALDICRVIGNNAVHPGEIDLRDSPDTVQSIFSMINLIVEDRISRPKQIEAVYDSLPIGAREAIAKRDE